MNKYQVEYLLIGGTAVGFYGYVRPSAPVGFVSNEMKHDLDFWYNPTIKNFYQLLKALSEFGVETRELEKIVFDPKKTFLRIPMKTYKMEFLCQISGIKDFNESRGRAKNINLEGQEIFLISLNDLIKNKQSVGRDVDKRDIQELKNRNYGLK